MTNRGGRKSARSFSLQILAPRPLSFAEFLTPSFYVEEVVVVHDDLIDGIIVGISRRRFAVSPQSLLIEQ